MLKYILLYLIIAMAISCSRVGYYYTSKQSSDEENVSINSENNIKHFGLSANIVDSSLNVIVFFKLSDTSKPGNYNIESINFSLNNLSSKNAKKSILFIDQPLRVKYQELSDIKNLKERIYSGLPLEFLFEFNSKDLIRGQEISVKISIDANQQGRKEHIEKNIEMIRRGQYRFWGALR